MKNDFKSRILNKILFAAFATAAAAAISNAAAIAEEPANDAQTEVKPVEKTEQPVNSETPHNYPFRLEAYISYDHFLPYDPFGSWESASLLFFHTVTPRFTYYAQASYFDYNGSHAGVFAAGAIIDWHVNFNSFTALSSATDTLYTNRFRLDQSFNFPIYMGEWVFRPTLGITYADAYNGHKDVMPFAGGQLRYKEWGAEYLLYFDACFPGPIMTLSQRLTLDYSVVGKYAASVSFAFGKQGYLAAQGLLIDQVVANRFYDVSANYRHWFADNWGLYGRFQYVQLADLRKQFDFLLGGFFSF